MKNKTKRIRLWSACTSSKRQLATSGAPNPLSWLVLVLVRPPPPTGLRNVSNEARSIRSISLESPALSFFNLRYTWVSLDLPEIVSSFSDSTGGRQCCCGFKHRNATGDSNLATTTHAALRSLIECLRGCTLDFTSSSAFWRLTHSLRCARVLPDLMQIAASVSSDGCH